MPLDTGQMLWRYKQGVSLSALAKETGLSRQKIKRRLNRLRWDRGEIVIEREDLEQCLCQGMTRKQIADRYLCCESIISKKCKQYGLKMRPRGCATFIDKSQS